MEGVKTRARGNGSMKERRKVIFLQFRKQKLYFKIMKKLITSKDKHITEQTKTVVNVRLFYIDW